MDEKTVTWDSSGSSGNTAMPVVAAPSDDPELHYPFYHQRGRRRRRSPPAMPAYDSHNVPLSLAMTTPQLMHRPFHPPRMRDNPHPRQQTPSGSSGTFRGRCRYRSPSVGATAAVAALTAPTLFRKASSRSSRPNTRSSSVASSMHHISRPSSPHEWWGATSAAAAASGNGYGKSSSWLRRSVSRSRGRQGRRVVPGSVADSAAARRGIDSPSPRRKTAYRTPMETDHAMMMQHYIHHALLAPPRPHAKTASRRGHCPSRSGSAEGYHDDTSDLPAASSLTIDPIAMAARRRRRRQRTQSRPRPRRVMSGDRIGDGGGPASNGLYELAGYYTFDHGGPAAHAEAIHVPGDTTAATSLVQFQTLLAESSDTTSVGDAMDVEMG
ncbi:hypothetical protein HMPREF1624_02132 [Sporothrix schenckii ATCC 58251]|uniref:Uncharacterized protein n=2 Tax=Sporothrix schenckii TaxID=29908 RepID=U7PZ97_SPOS1|nr:hypothetical protein HMPREF1624_02132 [Sporothrix schenckii ATCC 58251]